MNHGNNNFYDDLNDIIEGGAGLDEILQHGGSGAQGSAFQRSDNQFANLPVPLPDIPINQHPLNTFGVQAGVETQESDGPPLPPNPNPPQLARPPPPPSPPPFFSLFPLPLPPSPPRLPKPSPKPPRKRERTPSPPRQPEVLLWLPLVNGSLPLQGGVRLLGGRSKAMFDASFKIINDFKAKGKSLNDCYARMVELGLKFHQKRSFGLIYDKAVPKRRMTVEVMNDIWKCLANKLTAAATARFLGWSASGILGYIDREEPENRHSQAWTDVENTILRNRIARYGGNTDESWEEVKFALFGRSVLACKSRYEELCSDLWDPRSRTRDINIIGHMLSDPNGVKNWDEIAQEFPDRDAIMCELYYERHNRISLL